MVYWSSKLPFIILNTSLLLPFSFCVNLPSWRTARIYTLNFRLDQTNEKERYHSIEESETNLIPFFNDQKQKRQTLGTGTSEVVPEERRSMTALFHPTSLFTQREILHLNSLLMICSSTVHFTMNCLMVANISYSDHILLGIQSWFPVPITKFSNEIVHRKSYNLVCFASLSSKVLIEFEWRDYALKRFKNRIMGCWFWTKISPRLLFDYCYSKRCICQKL